MPSGCPFNVGDTGPGGGIVFSVPGQGLNGTVYYFEVAPVDVSTTQRNSAVQGQKCLGLQNAIPGAEFGINGIALTPSLNGSNIGDGLNNTIHLNTFPLSVSTSNPTNPVLDFHDLAAKLCADYVGPNGDTDWFLPSLFEAVELMQNVGPASSGGNVAGLSTGTSNPASAFYWTSSVVPTSGHDNLAFGVNVLSQVPQDMERCTTGSVRPVRRFECEIGSDLYNYRDMYVTRKSPLILGSIGHVDGACGSGNAYPNVPGMGRLADVIGLYKFKISPSLKDVNGTLYSINDFTQSTSGWTISIWDLKKQFLGKWHYNTLHSYSSPTGTGTHVGNIVTNVGIEEGVTLILKGVTHLDGPDPVVNYGNLNSSPIYVSQRAAVGAAEKAVEPEYHRGHSMSISMQIPLIASGSFAYIKIETDATVASASFNNVFSGVNTTMEQMNVICAPLMSTVSPLGTGPGASGNFIVKGAIGCQNPQLGAASTVYGLPCHFSLAPGLWNHSIFPWPATHQNVPTGCTWFPNLSAAIPFCGSTTGGGIAKLSNPELSTTDEGIVISTKVSQYSKNKNR